MSLLRVYEASPEIASFVCPASRCCVSPVELSKPGALDVVKNMFNSEALAERLSLVIVGRTDLREGVNSSGATRSRSNSATRDDSGYQNDASQHITAPTLPPPPLSTLHVTLIDSFGRRSRDLVENLSTLPRLIDVKQRRDLFMKKFSCFVNSVRLVEDDKRSGGGGGAVAVDLETNASSSIEMVVVTKRESERLKVLNEQLLIFHESAQPQEYFFPRKGHVVIGSDADGAVLRFLLERDVAFGDKTASVR